MRHTILAALLAAAILGGCGDGGATDAGVDAPEPADTIKIADFVYEPGTARVAAGAAIEVSNADAAPHTITDTGAGKAFDSGTIEGNGSTTLTIDKPGTYRYICEFHPFMKGEITVAG